MKPVDLSSAHRGRMQSAALQVLLVISVLLLAALASFFVVFAPILLLLLAGLIVGVAVLVLGGWWAKRKGKTDRALTVDLILLWAMAINLPAYTRFDIHGVERPDLINPQSLGRIVLTIVVAFVFVFGGVLRRRPAKEEGAGYTLSPWALSIPLLIYGWYIVDAGMLLRGSSLLLALFRAFEWVLYILIALRVVNRYLQTTKAADPRELMSFGVPMAAFPVILAFVMACTVPMIAFSAAESGGYRLQTPFTHPNVLGILAGVTFYYVLETIKRWRVWLLLGVVAVLLGTYSRGSWVGFMIATGFWLVLKVKPGLPRALTLVLVVLLGVGGYVGRDQVLNVASVVLARNKSNAEDVTSASQRTLVWKYSRILINQSPWVGHGYVAGPKKLIDLMASGESGSYFRSMHAHNEFIQAQINGGLPATVLTLAFHLHLLLMGLRLSGSRMAGLGRCAVVWTVLALTHGMLTPLTSERLMPPVNIEVFLYVWCCYALRSIRQERGVASAGVRAGMQQHIDSMVAAAPHAIARSSL